MAAIPYYEVYINFNRDRDYNDAEEDVTKDVRQFNIVRGVQLDNNRQVPAATLDFMVDNRSHKYTPTKDTSPLYPNILPGPNVKLRIAYPGMILLRPTILS